MMPTPIPGKVPAKQYRPATGNLKRDINLLPANENSEKMARNVAIIVGVAVGLAILYVVAILLPSMKLNAIKGMANSAQNQIAALSGADNDFSDSVAQRNALKEMIDSLNLSSKDYKQPADLFEKLSSICPGSITLTAVTQDGDGLTLEGRAPSDADVAQFIVNLGTITGFDRVVLASVGKNTDDPKSSQTRAFVVKCMLPAATASPLPTSAPTATEQGGAGK
jgi:type IV pilus assembly protein PilN